MLGITSIIAAIAGAINGLLPDLIKEFRDSRDAQRERDGILLQHRLELERLDKQAAMKISEATALASAEASKAAAAEAAAWAETQKAFYASAAAQPTGIVWIDALNAVLRPACVVLYLALFGLAGLGIVDMVPKETFAPLFTEAFVAIFSYLFVYRGTRKEALFK